MKRETFEWLAIRENGRMLGRLILEEGEKIQNIERVIQVNLGVFAYENRRQKKLELTF